MTVSATSTPVIIAREEAVGENLASNLVRVPCICYPINFRKKSVSALLNSSSEVNTVYLAFVKKLDLSIRPTDMGAQKIDGTMLETYRMVVAAFSLENKANQVRFFEETFLVANVSPEVVLGMSFHTLSGADVDFLGRELWWRTYTTKKALPTIKRIELVGKKEFAAVALDPKHKTYIVHVGSVSFHVSPNSSASQLKLDVHPFYKPQISSLIVEEASTKVSAKYLDYTDVFSSDLASELPEHIGINDHAIELVEDQQPPSGPIYNLRPVEFETLKAYIETHLINKFIRSSKSLAGAPILFDRKSDGFLQLCVNY